MKSYLPALIAASLCGTAAAVPIELSAGALTYSQNFDALASAPNNNPAVSQWADDSTIQGWSWYVAGNAVTPTGLAGPTYTYYVGDGNAAPQTAPLAHNFYSLGIADQPDRALGMSSTTGLGELSAILIFQNVTAGALKLSHVKFTAETYRANNTANNRDSTYVWWKAAADTTSLLSGNTTATTAGNPAVFIVGTNTTGPTSYYINNWNNLPEFTYTHTTPVASAAFNPPETQTFDAAPSSQVVVQPGQYLGIRWSNINDGGADALEGIDDLELTFAPTSGCVVDATVTALARLPGANPASPADDSVRFTIIATAISGSAGGWKVPAGGLAGGTTGAYSTPVTITVPIADFGATGTATLRVEDSAESECFKTVSVTAPPSGIVLDTGTLIYTQNFDALASATNNAAATTPWADDNTIPGWWWYRAGNAAVPTGLAGLSAAYSVGDGTAAPDAAPLALGYYSLGAADAPDRALGLVPTTAQGELSAIVLFHNVTAGPLKLSNVKFTAEAYRTNSGANNFDSVFVWWKAGPSPSNLLMANTTDLSANNTTEFLAGTNVSAPNAYYITGWNHLPEYTYTSNNAAASLALPPETQTFNSAPTSGAVIVPAGEYIAIRWSNLNDGSVDAMLGIDDLELTFTSTVGCIVDAAVTSIIRLPGADVASALDDSVQFTVNATATSGSPSGWKVPAGGFAGGITGAYGSPKVVTVPITDFGATGNATLRVEDAADPNCSKVVTISAPAFVQKVTATNSPVITFTPSAIGDAAFTPPAADQSELGWTGGTAGANTNSNVQKQPDSGAFIGTNNYWHLTTATTTFTTAPVDVSALAGQSLQGKIELAFYSTSTTELDDNDVVNGRMEVAVDGNFTNTAAGNILTASFVDVSGVGAPQAFTQSIPAANPYIDLGVVGYPAADFTFHPITRSIAIPGGATSARARIIFASGAGVSNTEHILLDNVRFSLSTVAGDTDGDGMPDDYENANGLNPNSNADRDADFDGDGQSNLHEYEAGTAANDPASTLRIIAASITAANEISGTWTSVAGKRYQIKISTDLGNSVPWANLGPVITATGSTTSIPPTPVPGGNPRYFLRVAIAP
ncbi:MAG TPA: hypothetical protein VG796_09670 [Verrucomicrobiales bacterium]|nr:hypothetical protein [Verrucomicrobiales bacterium]